MDPRDSKGGGDDVLSLNPALLFIVEPARLDAYERLCRNYSGESHIRVILDRRQLGRRDRARANAIDRRDGHLVGPRPGPRRGDGYIVVERGLA